MVHAANGTVCIEDVTTAVAATPCSSQTGPIFDGPSITPNNHQLNFGVYVEGSNALNGWDITFKVDHSLLVPASVDASSSIVGPPAIPSASLSVVVLCLQGVSVIGNCLATDTIDTLHYSVVGGITTGTTTGLLFTATYNIVSKTAAGGVVIDYQKNCAGAQSVTGSCVAILTGTPQPAPETAQTGKFDNSATPAPGVGTGVTGVPYITLASNVGSVTTLAGVTSSTITLTGTGQNGWPGTSTDLVTFSAVGSNGLTIGLPAGTTCSIVPGPCTASFTVKPSATMAPGNYAVTVYGSFAAVGYTSLQTSTLAATVTISVKVTSFTWTLSPNSVNVPTGTSPTVLSTGTVASVNGFAGTVTVSSITIPGLTVSFNPTSIPITAGGTGTTQISLSTTAGVGTTFMSTTRATTTGLPAPKSAPLTVHVIANSLAPTSTTISCAQSTLAVGSSTICTATVTDTRSSGATNPSGTVVFASTIAGIFNPPSCTLANSGTTAANCTASYVPSIAGSHSLSATYSGDGSHSGSGSTSPFLLTATMLSPTISTTLSATSITVGGSVTDSSMLSGATGNAGGTVTYQFFSGATCTAPATVVGTTVTVTNGIVPSSAPQTFSTAGSFSWNAVYSGDVSNNAATSPCEPLTVSPPHPDFTITASPSTLTINLGGSATSTIMVAPLNSFTGSISLTAAASGPTAGLNPNSISTSGTSTLTITAGSSVVPGAYKINVTGTSGSLVHTVTVLVTIFDFSITPSASTVSQVNAGMQGTVTITVNSLTTKCAFGCSSAPVSLIYSADAGLTCTLTPAKVDVGPPPAAIAASVLSCSATVYGNYTVTVTGNSTTLSHSTGKITFNVVDFVISANPADVPPVVLGTNSTSTITITGKNGFKGTVALSWSSAEALLVRFTPNPIVGSGTSALSVGADFAGNFTLTVAGSVNGMTHTVTVKVAFLGLGLAASPSSVTIVAGTSGTTTVTVSSINGFAGPVSLSTSYITPGGPAVSFSQRDFTLIKGGSGSAILTITVAANTYPGIEYLINVTATSGVLGAWTIVHVTVPQPDFTISVSSLLLQGLSARSPATVMLTVTAQNGFMDNVTLTLSPPAGMTASVNPSLIIGGSGTATLTVNALTAGSYAVTITGTSGSLSHSATVSVNAVDFAFTLNPNKIGPFDPGGSASSSIVVSPLNGFSGNVVLTVSAPNALSVHLNPAAITGGSGTSTVTVTGSEPGDYNVTITGTSGTLRHAILVKVTVTSGASGVFGLSSPAFYGGLAALIVIVVVASALVMRARSRPKK